jgi:tetratricopeptide (TPR) repeat protein
VLNDQGKHEKAVRAYRQAIHIKPDYAEAQGASGRHTKRGQFDVTVVVSACTSFSSEPLICRFPSSSLRPAALVSALQRYVRNRGTYDNRNFGDFGLISPTPHATKAEAYFERALTIAREQQANSWELRSAMSTARLWRDEGKRDGLLMITPEGHPLPQGDRTR